jgi:ribonuclease P protein component
MPGLVLQARDRGDDAPPRIGFTATKKLGNAVMRNRVKRRLREAARMAISAGLRPGFDYVLIGRAATAARPFGALRQDLTTAMARFHAARDALGKTEGA